MASSMVLGSGRANSHGDQGTRNPDSTVRKFTVHAIPVDIVYNRFGVHQPNGAMYVLEENLNDARRASGTTPGDAFEELKDGENTGNVDTSVIEPLVIRANQGDVIDITLVNHLEQRTSLHLTGLPYEVQTSDGMAVGFNNDTTVPAGKSTRYRWHATDQGTFYFRDYVNQAYDSAPDGNPEEVNNLARGLFGALVVEPPGATWTDPETGDELRSGTRADVHDPDGLGTSYREFVIFYHDPGTVVDQDGNMLTHPHSEVTQTVHGINYRGDQTGARLQVRDDCNPEACTDEANFYSSWVHGDPGGGDLVFETYQGDPVKVCIVGANLEENHSHHLHNRRWKEIPGRSDSDTIDTQSLGPGATYEQYLTVGHGAETAQTSNPDMKYTKAFEAGMGGQHGTAGDTLFHCHLVPHYAEGMNGLVRVHDKEQEHLQHLPNNDPSLEADSNVPGFPEFLPGEKGETPPEPPYERDGEPTGDERRALGDDIVPGAPYADPALDNQVNRTIEYTITVLDETDLVYNDAGDHDPEGQLYVLEEVTVPGVTDGSVQINDIEAIRKGEMNPEPLIIRANVGDCVKITLKNEAHNPKSIHPHFVRYDLQGSDCVDLGYNYEQTVSSSDTDEAATQKFRWFANEEGTIFFHDHGTAIGEGMKGAMGAIIVEPEGSEWLDPHTGDPLHCGSQAMIKNPDGEDFREFALVYHDFAQLVDRNGELVTEQVQHNQNAGVMAINYRNAPYYHRDDEDPAYLHSSAVHGDPPTPVLETYPDDPVRIRLVNGLWEEQHNFHMHGVELDTFGTDPTDAQGQITNVAEAFTFRVREGHQFDQQNNPAGLPVRDYLYGSMIADDIYNGMWGIHRVFGAEVDHLQPLPEREAPNEEITENELREMGHPAPFDRRAEQGHMAKFTYDEDADRQYPPNKNARRNEYVGEVPPSAPDPGTPCLADAETRVYNVTAIQTTIKYNDYGDHDPHGIVFVPDDQVEDVRDGNRHPEPLTIRANEGECVEIRLTNELPETLDDEHAHPEMRADQSWEQSNRISLHPVNITYDVNGSDGATVGFNWDQTVAPGETITYRWFASEQTDGCILWDMADIRGHRHHGSFGQLIVEPSGSTWLDPRTAEPIETSTEAMITNHDDEDFREFALSFSDGMHIINSDGSCVVPPGHDTQDLDVPCNQIGDPEDQGYVGINNRSEPFARRFETNDAQHLVFSSKVHGDPNTPVLNAYLDDPVTLRINQPADKPRGLAFHLAGHQWERFRGTKGDAIPAPLIGVEDDISPGKSHNINPIGGAGGKRNQTGDFVYQAMKLHRRLEAGWWGIFRVRRALGQFMEPVQPLPDRSEGLHPEERPGWRVARGDVTGDGTEDLLVGVPDSRIAGDDAGAAYLFEGPIQTDEITDLAEADVQFLGTPGKRVGHDVAIKDNRIHLYTADRETQYIYNGRESLPNPAYPSDADETN